MLYLRSSFLHICLKIEVFTHSFELYCDWIIKDKI